MRTSSVEFPRRIGGEEWTADQVIEALRPFITAERMKKMENVVAQRTFSILPVVEGLYDLGNVNAVLRSAEALGYQNIHVVQSGERFKVANRISQGTDHWLDVRKWSTTAECVGFLRERGYQLAVTHLSEGAVAIDEVDFSRPTAVVFGNEKEGVSREMVAAADVQFLIPMSGFAQSFNISVAAAITLYHIAQDRKRRLGQHGDLSAEQQHELLANFCLRNVARAEDLLARHRA